MTCILLLIACNDMYPPPHSMLKRPTNTMKRPTNTMKRPTNTMKRPTNTMKRPTNTMKRPTNIERAGMRDVTLDELSYKGGPLSLAPSRTQQRDYFVVQAIVVGLSLFRVLKYLGASSMFGGLVETLKVLSMGP
jgi:hypothetical protein